MTEPQHEWVAIGIDGGQSTLRARSIAASAGASDMVQLPGVGHDVDAPAATLAERLAELVDALVPTQTPTRVVAGLTLIPTDPAARDEFAQHFFDRRPTCELSVTGDAVTTHAGAFGGDAGVAMAVGTGIACLAVGHDGQTRQFDGAGYLIGDEGGGFWLGSRGVRAALAAHEHRGDSTALLAAARTRFGDVCGLADRLHRSSHPVVAIAEFAPVVLDAAGDGDPVASGIVRDAAHRLATTIGAAVSFADADRVACSGRLVTARTDYIATVSDALAASGTSPSTFVSGDASLDGALWLARRRDAGPYAPLVDRIVR